MRLRKDNIMKTNTIAKSMRANGFIGTKKNETVVAYKSQIADGSVSLDRMVAMGVVHVDLINDLNDVLAKASYAAEASRVGGTTLLMEIAGTNPEVYFNEDGKFNKDLFMKVFKIAGTKTISGSKYETIYFEGVNKFSEVDFEMGIKYHIYLVNKATIELYQERLATMDLDAVTCVGDIEQIIIDLDPIARAFQESAIDVVKDKDKDFGIYSEDIVGSDIKALSNVIKQFGTTNNIGAVLKDCKKVKYACELAVSESIEVMPTNASKAQIAILEGTNEFMDKLVESLGETTLDDYRAAVKLAVPYREFVWFIRKVTDSMIGSLEADGRIQAETVRLLRDAIYVEANRAGVPTEMVIKCAIAAGCTYFSKGMDGKLKGSTNLNGLRFPTITKLFDDIFVKEYSVDNKLLVELDVADVFEDLEEGTEVVLEDGFGYVDGNKVLSLMDETINGNAIVGDRSLMLDYNPEENIKYDHKILIVDAFLTRENDQWVDIDKELGLAGVDVNKDKLLNCQCGIKEVEETITIRGKKETVKVKYILAKNPQTGGAVRIARLNSNFDAPLGAIKKVKTMVMSKYGVSLIVEA